MKAAMQEFHVRDTAEIAAILTRLGPERVIGLVAHPANTPGGANGVQIWFWESDK